MFVGLLVGSMSSGQLYLVTSASFVFGLATLSALIALICMYLFVDESVKNVTGITSSWVRYGCYSKATSGNMDRSTLQIPIYPHTKLQAKFKAFFNVRHVCDLFNTCFKRRENHDRILIWMVIFTLATTMFVLGE